MAQGQRDSETKKLKTDKTGGTEGQKNWKRVGRNA